MSDEPTLTALAEQEEVIKDLKSSLTRTTRQLAKVKNSKVELTEAVYQAVKDNVLAITVPEYPKAPKDQRIQASETAIAVLSDWQLAKVTKTYNSQVCADRVKLYGDKLLKLVEIQRADHPIRKLHIDLAGDLVEGEQIFPGQSFLIDASLYQQVVKDGPEILVSFIVRMASEFDEVHVTGAIGNHGAIGGRGRKEYHPESNADRMLYKIAQTIIEAKGISNVTFNIPDGGAERNWYAIDTIGDKSFLIMHGDQIRGGFAGMPWYGFQKKVLGWNAGAIPESFDYVICGHWHQPVSFVLNDKLVWVNGSTESNNTYAQEMLAASGRPCQWLLFAHPEHGVTNEYRVWLDH
jgi:hypothetical protein